MRLSKPRMRWSSITEKLKVGVVHRFNSAIEKIAYTSARTTGQLEGFGETDIVGKLQAGDFFPDQLFGWSTKTILAALLLLMLFKVKKLQGAA